MAISSQKPIMLNLFSLAKKRAKTQKAQDQWKTRHINIIKNEHKLARDTFIIEIGW